MRYTLLVTGPAYGTQQASSALLFSKALIGAGHQLSIFFYCEGVLNANQLTMPASDEFDLVRAWYTLHQQNVVLNICVSAALRRGIIDKHEATDLGLPIANVHPGFQLVGLSLLAEMALTSDRLIQF